MSPLLRALAVMLPVGFLIGLALSGGRWLWPLDFIWAFQQVTMGRVPLY